jgi:hypothetical protein
MNNEQLSIKVGDRVTLIALPPYLKTAEPMPMLRSPDSLKIGDCGVVTARRPGGYWEVNFSNGAFLLDRQYLQLIEAN